MKINRRKAKKKTVDVPCAYVWLSDSLGHSIGSFVFHMICVVCAFEEMHAASWCRGESISTNAFIILIVRHSHTNAYIHTYILCPLGCGSERQANRKTGNMRTMSASIKFIGRCRHAQYTYIIHENALRNRNIQATQGSIQFQ